jgi:energy-coupling factor transporter ATP-binding protein EcfA2/ABC-type multidrug transport system permease subunit
MWVSSVLSPEIGVRIPRQRLTNINRSSVERLAQIKALLESFGLTDQAHTIIGTSLRRGISDGQKRRVAIARQLVASPKILFLDEPTSGLDSAAGFEVVHYLQALARRNNLIIIFSIHQPSRSIFNLFDKLLLISAGKTQYFGAAADAVGYYSKIGIEIPLHTNIPDFLLELVNIDFSQDRVSTTHRLMKLQSAWQASVSAMTAHDTILCAEYAAESLKIESGDRPSIGKRIVTLLHRSLVKTYYDPMAYAIRLAFAFSFGLLVGTVWLRLDHDQESIQSLASEIFFTLCFMSLAAIIYAPDFIEDYAQFTQDFQNGLYGPTEFVLSNFIISIPTTFLLSFVFSIVSYWLSNLIPSVTAFFTWVLWIFLTSLAAEALVVLVASILPDFMFTIACASFLNSLLLCCQGFFISYSRLNVFYKFGFYYWDYLGYSFQGIMLSQFSGATYSCGDNCSCVYASDLASQCQIAGEVILDRYGFKETGQFGRNVGIVIAITIGYRLVSWILIIFKN